MKESSISLLICFFSPSNWEGSWFVHEDRIAVDGMDHLPQTCLGEGSMDHSLCWSFRVANHSAMGGEKEHQDPPNPQCVHFVSQISDSPVLPQMWRILKTCHPDSQNVQPMYQNWK